MPPPRDSGLRAQWDAWVTEHVQGHIARQNLALLQAVLDANCLTCPDLHTLAPALGSRPLGVSSLRQVVLQALK